MRILGALVVLSLSLSAHAQRPKDSPECAEIAKQCESAGFSPGGHKKDGKGLWVECIGAVAHGQTVAGVTATKEQAEKCLAVAKEKHKKHAE